MSVLLLPNGLDRQTLDLTELQIQVLIEIEPLLKAARLHLVCPRCLAAGRSLDALVGGDNGRDDKTWSVSCPCTTRTYRRASGH